MTKWSVIIPAAGSGERLGSKIPKPFLKVGGSAILQHTILRFLEVADLLQVIVATSKQSISDVKGIFNKISQSAGDVEMLVVEGAAERQLSIANTLSLISDQAELVAIHDAVRPFVKAAHIRQCCEAAKNYGGAVLGVPAKDTIKRVNADSIIIETPNRKDLWQAQTPQVFRKELLLAAYEEAANDKFIGTDDASLVERIGGKVQMVEGERENLKVTYPMDLEIAELILKGNS